MKERNQEKNDNKKPQEGGNNNYNGLRNQGNNQPQMGNNNKKRGKLNGNQSDNRRVQQKTGNEDPPPTCGNYGKNYFIECCKGTLSCFSCGQSGHFIKDCLKQNQAQGNQTQ